MRRWVHIVSVTAFALVLARANAFSQSPSALADPRFDSLGRVAIERFVDGKFFFKHPYDLLVPTADSSLFSLFAMHRHDKHVFYGSDASVIPTNPDDSERQLHVFTSIRRHIDYEQGGKDTTFVRATLALEGYTPGYVPVPFISSIEVFRDTIVPSARIMVTDEAPADSFWNSTLKPVLITVGAAAIVALFFLIRS